MIILNIGNLKNISFVKMKKKKINKIENRVLKIIKRSKAEINFNDLGDKLKLNTKKDLKILKKKLRNLTQREKIVSNKSRYSFIQKN